MSRDKPRGRLLDETAFKSIYTLVKPFSHDKSQLLEALHAVQDEYGALSKVNLQALAECFRLSMAEVFEVASFYHHFIISDEPQKPIIRVCENLSCSLYPASTFDEEKFNVVKCACLGRCNEAPAVQHGAFVAPKQKFKLKKFEYYDSLKNGVISVETIISKLESANLRGLGGAGFPTFKKWALVREAASPRYLVVNADEGEVGTFKDKYLLENHLNQVLEGILIAGEVIKAAAIYIYVRDEYPLARELLKSALKQLNRDDIHLRRGAGAYICGEESALIESLEGKRGYPRLRPPFVAEVGLFGRPTLVNNVETLYFITDILEDRPIYRHYSVSGRVKNAGVYKAKAGTSALQLIDMAGGMIDGHTFKAYLPGGASGGILPASLGHEPLDFGVLAKHGAFVGSHALIILSDKDDLKEASKNLMSFFKHESCGQCTPCREGTGKALELMKMWDSKQLTALGTVMMDASICGLGQAAPNPFLSILRHFKEEIEFKEEIA